MALSASLVALTLRSLAKWAGTLPGEDALPAPRADDEEPLELRFFTYRCAVRTIPVSR